MATQDEQVKNDFEATVAALMLASNNQAPQQYIAPWDLYTRGTNRPVVLSGVIPAAGLARDAKISLSLTTLSELPDPVNYPSGVMAARTSPNAMPGRAFGLTFVLFGSNSTNAEDVRQIIATCGLFWSGMGQTQTVPCASCFAILPPITPASDASAGAAAVPQAATGCSGIIGKSVYHVPGWPWTGLADADIGLTALFALSALNSTSDMPFAIIVEGAFVNGILTNQLTTLFPQCGDPVAAGRHIRVAKSDRQQLLDERMAKNLAANMASMKHVKF